MAPPKNRVPHPPLIAISSSQLRLLFLQLQLQSLLLRSRRFSSDCNRDRSPCIAPPENRIPSPAIAPPAIAIASPASASLAIAIAPPAILIAPPAIAHLLIAHSASLPCIRLRLLRSHLLWWGGLQLLLLILLFQGLLILQ
jgi:hypothetical protein